MTNDTPTVHGGVPDRVRAATHPDVNSRIDRDTEHGIRAAAAEPDSGKGLSKLGREWDIERVLEAEVAATGLIGLVLSVTVNRKFLIIPAVATSMMLVHALHGWYPLLPLLRRMGVRTQDEIDRERYALKALRGDFSGIADSEGDGRAEAAWCAVHA